MAAVAISPYSQNRQPGATHKRSAVVDDLANVFFTGHGSGIKVEAGITIVRVGWDGGVWM